MKNVYNNFAGWTQLATEDFAMCTFTVPELEGKSHRMTSINFSPDGQDVLVSYSSDHIYLFNVKVLGIYVFFARDMYIVFGIKIRCSL